MYIYPFVYLSTCLSFYLYIERAACCLVDSSTNLANKGERSSLQLDLSISTARSGRDFAFFTLLELVYSSFFGIRRKISRRETIFKGKRSSLQLDLSISTARPIYLSIDRSIDLYLSIDLSLDVYIYRCLGLTLSFILGAAVWFYFGSPDLI